MNHSRKARSLALGPLALAGMLANGALAARAAGAPPTIAYSTYLGGSAADEATAIAVDASGNVYVTGSTTSPDFPVVAGSGPVESYPDFPVDIFVTEIAPDGSPVLSTVFGTEWSDYATAIALDPQGGIHIAGWVDTGGDIQTLVGTVDRRDGSGRVGIPFTGASLSQAFGLAINARGYYLIGRSNADIGDPHHRPGESDGPSAYVTELAAGVRGSYFAGPCDAEPIAVALDPAGFIYVTGWTRCANLPLVRAAQPAPGGGSDAFVLKLDPADFSVVYLTYLGGSADEQGLAIAADRAGNAYVTGWTTSADLPLQRPLQASLRGPSDLFVAELGPRGALLRSTYLGGTGGDAGQAIAVDRVGAVYLAGFASAGFPRNPAQAGCGTPSCAGSFVARLDLARGVLAYSTFLGGGGATVVDASGNVATTGTVFGSSLATVHAFQPAYGGGPDDAFVTRVIVPVNRPPLCAAGHGSPATAAGSTARPETDPAPRRTPR